MATLTVYPAAGAASPIDGRIYLDGFVGTWAAARAEAAGNGNEPTSANTICTQGEVAPNKNISRCTFLFDTSALTAGASISAAVLSLYSSADGNDSEGTNPADITIVGTTPAATDAIANADYAQFGTTKYSDTTQDLGAFIASSAYFDFAFNATGIAAISLTGITKLGTRAANDYSDATAPSARSYGKCYYADQVGTTNDPKLVVTYTIPTRKRRFSVS